mmetsp:Transcript_43180/g.135714  ORF Transcript_43180/g.135714 Transcript_43180/m.135714 type:complete len:385 (-) Transcript_43180:29-1183(-)
MRIRARTGVLRARGRRGSELDALEQGRGLSRNVLPEGVGRAFRVLGEVLDEGARLAARVRAVPLPPVDAPDLAGVVRLRPGLAGDFCHRPPPGAGDPRTLHPGHDALGAQAPAHTGDVQRGLVATLRDVEPRVGVLGGVVDEGLVPVEDRGTDSDAAGELQDLRQRRVPPALRDPVRHDPPGGSRRGHVRALGRRGLRRGLLRLRRLHHLRRLRPRGRRRAQDLEANALPVALLPGRFAQLPHGTEPHGRHVGYLKQQARQLLWTGDEGTVAACKLEAQGPLPQAGVHGVLVLGQHGPVLRTFDVRLRNVPVPVQAQIGDCLLRDHGAGPEQSHSFLPLCIRGVGKKDLACTLSLSICNGHQLALGLEGEDAFNSPLRQGVQGE